MSQSTFQSNSILKAYVLSMSENRWKSTSALLYQANLLPIKIVPIPLNSTVMTLDGKFGDPFKEKFRKYHNNKLSHIRFWRQIAYDSTLEDDGFSLIFEDDIALHPLINISDVESIIRKAANLSKAAGFFYLGVCDPQYRNSIERNDIKYSECIGHCSHAYGVFKWRAEWLYEELAAVSMLPDFFYFHSIDKYFVYGFPSLLGNGPWPYVAGAHLISDIQDSHRGIFFQDRLNFPSEARPDAQNVTLLTVV